MEAPRGRREAGEPGACDPDQLTGVRRPGWPIRRGKNKKMKENRVCINIIQPLVGLLESCQRRRGGARFGLCAEGGKSAARQAERRLMRVKWRAGRGAAGGRLLSWSAGKAGFGRRLSPAALTTRLLTRPFAPAAFRTERKPRKWMEFAGQKPVC